MRRPYRSLSPTRQEVPLSGAPLPLLADRQMTLVKSQHDAAGDTLVLRGRYQDGFRGVGDSREGNTCEGEQGKDTGVTLETGDREGSAG